MGQVFRRFAAELIDCPSDAEIHERVMNLGPFIRTALCWGTIELKRFIDDWQNEINGLVNDPSKLRSRIKVMVLATGKSLSHREAIFVIHHNSTTPFLRYTVCDYDDVLRLIQVAIAQMNIEVVKAHLIAINQGYIGLSEHLSTFLEWIFELHSIDKGIQWKYRPMLLKENDREANWDLFMVNFTRVECNITTFQNMVENVLYYPDDWSILLVDMYYKNEFGLVGIQATMATEHAKNVSVYQEFYDKIGINPVTNLKLFYLFMPLNIDHFNKDGYTQSQFWKDVKSGVETQLENNITFFALLPPSSFEAIMPV
jgi:hypothetical protein